MTSHVRASAPPLSEPSKIALRVLLTLCLLIVWVLAYLLGISRLDEARRQHILYSGLRQQLAAATAPVGGPIPAGAAVALLEGPRGLLHDQVVVEGPSSSELRSGPGHVRSSPLPGQAGTSLLYGRATSFGAPFGDLAKLRPGDVLTAVTGQGTFHFRVDDLRRVGDPVPAASTATPSRLTLASVSGASLSNAWSSTSVIYVDATLQGIVAPTPAGRTSTILSSERLLAGDGGALTVMAMVLWLQALLVAVIGVSWARVRWGARPTWLVGVPIVFAALWGLTSTASALLPNVI
jgi:sortase A